MRRWLLGALATGFTAGAAFVLSTIIVNMVRVSLYGPESQPTWLQTNTRAIAFAAAFVFAAFTFWAWTRVTRPDE
jgi:hypothetical protein